MRIRYSLILIFFFMLFKDTSHAKALFMPFLSTTTKKKITLLIKEANMAGTSLFLHLLWIIYISLPPIILCYFGFKYVWKERVWECR